MKHTTTIDKALIDFIPEERSCRFKYTFGDYIVDTLNQAGVDIDSAFRTNAADTTPAFVVLGSDRSRIFSSFIPWVFRRNLFL